MQSWSLERKIRVTQTRIMEFYDHYGGQVYVSFSGGLDSTVLLDLARRVYPDIEAVYVDTGLEYPELRDFVKTFDNVTILKPELTFREVIKKYGYPVVSKHVAKMIGRYQNGSRAESTIQCLSGTYKCAQFNCANWAYLTEAPFNISSKCCDMMKKRPIHIFEKQSGKHGILGTLAEESRQRRLNWLTSGCNVFDGQSSKSQPLSFWTRQDELRYIKTFEIPYCSVYGEIVEKDNGELVTIGLDRTGCMFCGFGAHREKLPNRYQRLAETHPKIYDYILKDWDEGGLGFKKVLDYIGVIYDPAVKVKPKQKKRDENQISF